MSIDRAGRSCVAGSAEPQRGRGAQRAACTAIRPLRRSVGLVLEDRRVALLERGAEGRAEARTAAAAVELDVDGPGDAARSGIRSETPFPAAVIFALPSVAPETSWSFFMPVGFRSLSV